jgi:hypothetical protein
MDYPSRPRKPKKKAPDDGVVGDGPGLKLAQYSAPFGEEMPYRTATSDDFDLADPGRDPRPERGSLH